MALKKIITNLILKDKIKKKLKIFQSKFIKEHTHKKNQDNPSYFLNL